MSRSELASDAVADFNKLFWCEFEVLFSEIEVTLFIDRHQMDVGVRHFEADDGHGDAFAWDGFLDGSCHVFGKHHHLAKLLVIDVEDVVGFMFRHDEGMACRQGVDVEEREELVVLGDFVARDFTLDDSGENGSHNS